MNKQLCQVIILQSITTTSSLKDTAQELELAQLTPSRQLTGPASHLLAVVANTLWYFAVISQLSVM